MPKAKKTVKLEVMFEGEVTTGLEYPDPKFFNSGNIIEATEEQAASLLAARRVRKVAASSKVTPLDKVKRFSKEELEQIAADGGVDEEDLEE